MKKYALILAMAILAGCSSDDVSVPSGTINNTGAAIEISVLGTWDYLVRTENSICDGLFAQGTVTLQPLSTDSTKIGNIVLSGDGYDTDNRGNCFITQVNETDSDWSGRDANLTADEYLAFVRQDNIGDNTIQSIRLDAFNDSRIVEVETYTNTVIITTTLSR